MNKLIVTETVINKNKIQIKYEVEGEWSKYIDSFENFVIEYSTSIENTPKSIAVIPLLGTFITLSWIFDAQIIVDELDYDFYECLPELKKGYQTMYPDVDFNGSINVKNLVKNNFNGRKRICLFSGGVDAFSTLISHIDENPELITICGADIATENVDAWKVVESQTKNVAEIFGLGYGFIHSNFRKIMSGAKISKKIMEISGDSWWHGFHHGIGMLTLVAPYAYKNYVDIVYIASSFYADLAGKYTCSSDPLTDNVTKFSATKVVHDGYEYNRSNKITNICKFSDSKNISIPLRVCWQSDTGKNCCKCEKCLRTILGIYANKSDPRKYGFEYDNFSEVLNELKYISITKIRHESIQQCLKNNYTHSEVDKSLKWFYKLNFDTISDCYKHKYTFQEKKINTFNRLPAVIKKLYSVIKNK